MLQETQKLSVEFTADTTGFDYFFSCHEKADEGDLPLESVSKRPDLSERIVLRRLKNGQLWGYKIAGPRGPEWRIIVKSCEDTTAVEVLSTEDTTNDKKSTYAFTLFAEFYHDQIETRQEKLEATTYRNGYLEAQLSSAESQLKLLQDFQTRAMQVEILEHNRLKGLSVSHKRTNVSGYRISGHGL